jgi:hypothetical protein
MTVTEIPVDVPAEYDREAHARYVAGQLAPEKVRRGALSVLLGQLSPERFRVALTEACPDLAPVWRAWADGAEALAAHGISASRPRGAAKLALVLGSAGAQRREVDDEMDALLGEGFDPDVYAEEIDQALGGAR